MNQEIKLKAKISQFKQEFIVENNISLEDQEELDKYFL